MAPRTPTTAAVAALLVAGSVAGFMAGGSVDEALGVSKSAANDQEDPCSVPGAFSHPDEATVRSWSNHVPPDADGGTIEVASWYGGVHVTTWEADAYEVTVGEIDRRDAIEPTVEAGVADGAFSLVVDVEDANAQDVGPAAVGASAGQAEAHVKVTVPEKAYESVVAETSQANGITLDDSGEVGAWAHPPTGVAVPDNPERPILVEDLRTATVEADAHNRDVGVADVAAEAVGLATYHGLAAVEDATVDRTLTLAGYHGDTCVHASSADELALETRHGDARAVDVEATQASFAADSGDVTAQGLASSDVDASSEAGDVTLTLIPTGSGDVVADAYDGETKVVVPTGPDRGYEATATSQHGEAQIVLPNATTSGGDGGLRGETVHAETRGLADRPVQVNLTAETENGDALVLGQ